MSDVIELSNFIRTSKDREVTGLYLNQASPNSEFRELRERRRVAGTSSISADRLYGSEPSPSLTKFFSLATSVIAALEDCQTHLIEGETISADSEFMKCKTFLQQMFSLDDMDDSVALLSLRALQACDITVVTDTPQLPNVLLRVMTRLRHAPFIKFEEASRLALEIEKASGNSLSLFGYDEIMNALLSDDMPG